MMRYFPYLFFTAILILVSCENEPGDAPILTGTVKGHIEIQDGYGYNLDDLSGVQIEIKSNTFSADTVTDIRGNFQFDDVPFGKYYLTCKKDNFIQKNLPAVFGHSGGAVATTVNETLLEIPDFGYRIDSVISEDNCNKNFYVELYDARKVHVDNIHFVAMYFASTPEVDSENYEAFFAGVGSIITSGRIMRMYCCDYRTYMPVYSDFSGDSVYCRIYPIPFCSCDKDEDYLTLPKGKPSNVFAFKLNK